MLTHLRLTPPGPRLAAGAIVWLTDSSPGFFTSVNFIGLKPRHSRLAVLGSAGVSEVAREIANEVRVVARDTAISRTKIADQHKITAGNDEDLVGAAACVTVGGHGNAASVALLGVLAARKELGCAVGGLVLSHATRCGVEEALGMLSSDRQRQTANTDVGGMGEKMRTAVLVLSAPEDQQKGDADAELAPNTLVRELLEEAGLSQMATFETDTEQTASSKELGDKSIDELRMFFGTDLR